MTSSKIPRLEILVLTQKIEYKVGALNKSTSYQFIVAAVNSYTGEAGNYSSTGPEVTQTLGEHTE